MNEYKEEHYRRLAYVNEHFASTRPGWRTDRGRIYIMYGPPSEIESHPSGGASNLGSDAGGRTVSTYPYEVWRYYHIDGIGDDVTVRFEDRTGTGDYQMVPSQANR